MRGALLLRLTGFLSGYAGVSAELCQALADALNDGWCPAVPAAVTGAAGEIVPLCAHVLRIRGRAPTSCSAPRRASR